MSFDPEKMCETVRERRRDTDKLSRRLRGIESEIRHKKPVRILVDIMPMRVGTYEMEDHAVLMVLTDEDSIKQGFTSALKKYREGEIEKKVQTPAQLLSTDFALAFDTDGTDYFHIEMDEHGFYDLADAVLTAEVLNNQPED